MIAGTAHVGFTVDDLDAGIALFREVFGYALVSCDGRNPKGVALLTGLPTADITVAHLECPGLVGVELIAYREPAERDRAIGRPCDTGFVHLTFHATDLDDVMRRAAGHDLLPLGRVVGRRAPPESPGTGKRVVYLSHPTGINIELIEES